MHPDIIESVLCAVSVSTLNYGSYVGSVLLLGSKLSLEAWVSLMLCSLVDFSSKGYALRTAAKVRCEEQYQISGGRGLT